MFQGNRAPGGLLGRRNECAALDRLVAGLQGGMSAALVIHGEAGIGKTALLDHVEAGASDCKVVRVAGVEAESAIAFGALHQLCTPFDADTSVLPHPQRAALETAFGLSAGDPPDRFLVGLAVLGLLASVADDCPLVCLIDDAQWLDEISALTLGFVARRLLAERVLLVFAMRDPTDGHPLHGLPDLPIRGLADHDARALLDLVVPVRLDDRDRERVLTEAHGNPLALIELPRALTARPLDVEVATTVDQSVASRIEKDFLHRIRALAPHTQRLLRVAAAEPVGDVALLRGAAERLGVPVDEAVVEAERAGLITRTSILRFRHPLVRSAAYRFATETDLREVHQALADEIDPGLDPDRRAWHLAHAAAGPDEEVARHLEAAAERARARGGTSAAATLLDRAAQLTPEPTRRGTRALAAARAKTQVGALDEALELVDMARLSPLDHHDSVHADLLRGRILFSARSSNAGLPILFDAAQRLEELDSNAAAETYRDAMHAALIAGRLPGENDLVRVSTAVLARPRNDQPTRSDLLLQGLARVVIDGYAAGVPMLQEAMAAYRAADLSAGEGIGWLPLVCRLAHDVWEFETWADLSERLVDLARDEDELSVLPYALLLRLANRAYAGDLHGARALAARAATLADVTGSSFTAHYGALVTEPWRGSEAETRRAINAITHDMHVRDEGKVLTATDWAAAVLYNGSGRFEDALEAARRGASHPSELGLSIWSMVELVEAATRLGLPEEAADAVRHIDGMAQAVRTDWALGTAALVAAQVSRGAAVDVDAQFEESIARLERAGVGMLAARAHLLHGEWLRREDRRDHARRALGTAHERLSRIGAEAFAERARRELAATGVTMGEPRSSPGGELTPQEAQIAGLAAQGLTNSQIGAHVFLSGHTVEWHLRKVFTKLGVKSRREIAAALGATSQRRTRRSSS